MAAEKFETVPDPLQKFAMAFKIVRLFAINDCSIFIFLNCSYFIARIKCIRSETNEVIHLVLVDLSPRRPAQMAQSNQSFLIVRIKSPKLLQIKAKFSPIVVFNFRTGIVENRIGSK